MRLSARGAASLTMALGATGAAILAIRRAMPTIETVLADTGPIQPLPSAKPNAYVDADGRSLVSLAGSSDPVEGVRRAIDLIGGLDPIDVAGRRVLIKPNANAGLPAPASTSPAVLEEVIRLVQDHGARDVIVGEMSGPPWHDTTREMMRNGLLDVIDANGARFVDFRFDRWVTVPLGDRSRYFETVSIPRSVYEAERLIGLPVLKTHFLAGYSLSVKLWFGAVHPRNRIATHLARDWGRTLAELNLPFWPDLLVLDGGQAMISGGPKKGATARTDLYLASGDRVALDACGAAILAGFGASPALRDTAVWEQEQVRAAADLGLGVSGPDRVRLTIDEEEQRSAGFERALHDLAERAGIQAAQGKDGN